METVLDFLSGKYRLSTTPHEMRMSHWVYAPVIIDIETNEIILNLEGNIWDLRSAGESQDSIILKLSRYPDGVTEYTVEIIPDAATAIVEGVSLSVTRIVQFLDALV
ncbi:hypothetical protein L4D06_17620 [Enterovibrio makurazakiensis]|uniref:hypothetical protein n=1 Tax=Enterovibrio makurazakiensis TaxID=2910232 RepID=UPI003D1D8CBD